MTISAKTLPTECVFDITVDAEFVHIAWSPGRIFALGVDEPLTGRHDATKQVLAAQTDVDEDGEFTRVPLDGFVTDSASDALLWASELAQGSKGEFRRAFEVDHCVVVAAMAQVKP